MGDPKCDGGGYLFENPDPLTEGTLTSAKYDNFIMPSAQDSLPMTLNFLLEAKGPDGSLAAATLQACSNGALGTREIHRLQS